MLWPLAHALTGSDAHYAALWRARERLQGMPSLIVWGMKDPAFGPAYLARWRMMLAGEKLVSGHGTLARIASSLGYESEHAFNTAFKRLMGMSPRRYARAAERED